jgi:hypothetical protein
MKIMKVQVRVIAIKDTPSQSAVRLGSSFPEEYYGIRSGEEEGGITTRQTRLG